MGFSKQTKQSRFLALILLFVASDVLCDNYLAGSFINESLFRQFCVIGVLLLLQILISPIQAGISDFYGRRISLIVSLSFSLVSLIFVYLYDLQILAYLPALIFINLAKGIFGNTVPIAWAAVGDIEGQGLRYSFAKATASYAVGYLILIFFNKYFTNAHATLMVIITFIFSVFLCVKYFFDLKDIKFQEIKKSNINFSSYLSNEIRLIFKDIGDRTNQHIFLAWILWEISIYAILVMYADFINYESSLVEIVMMIGYLCGTYSIKFLSKIEDSKMIRIGYKISVAALIPYFVLFNFSNKLNIILAGCYFFHAIGNALLSPTLFSIISKRREAHERGKIYGLVESADTIAFLIAVILITVYKYFKMDVFFLVSFSFLTALLSWIPYRNFEKSLEKKSIF